MQTFSNMQRIVINKETISKIFVLLFFLVYEAISTIYLFLPPLLGVMFILYINSYKNKNLFLQLAIFAYLIIFEGDRGFLFLSSILFFVLSVEFVVKPLENIISCNRCLNFLFVFYVYLGYWLFITIILSLFEMSVPSFSYMIIYYALIEAIVVVLFL